MNVEKVIAVVGTRSASDYGKGFANQLIADLTEQQVLVVSGLAYGIDTAAHKAALKTICQPSLFWLMDWIGFIHRSTKRWQSKW